MLKIFTGWVIFLNSFISGTIDAQNKVRELSILFAGNSLTYTNDLPALLKAIAKTDQISIRSKSVCLPDYSLEDHWKAGFVQEELRKKKYDYLIAQQGPSSLEDSKKLLIEYTSKFKQVCETTGTKLGLLTVWPSRSRYFALDDGN